MRESVSGKVVMITGASSGIGAALARELAEKGARVALCARRTDRLEKLREEIQSIGARCIALHCDVNDPKSIAEAVSQATVEFGRIDIVVANAGFGVVGDFENLEVSHYRRQFETNVFGLLETAKASLQKLKETQGILVLIGSVASYISLPGNTPYSMSKFAVRAFAEGITPELKRDGVSVVLISPGFVESEIRRIDNQGVLHDEAADPVSPWLQMPAARAARIITGAIEKRKREQIVTFHGAVAIFIKRHFPWLFHWLSERGLRSRLEPRENKKGQN